MEQTSMRGRFEYTIHEPYDSKLDLSIPPGMNSHQSINKIMLAMHMLNKLSREK